MGSLWEAREDGVGGEPPKRAGASGHGKNYATLAQYFAIGKAHRGGNCYGRGREPGVQGAGSGKFRPPCSPPPHHHKGEFPLYPALCSLLRRHSFGSSRTPPQRVRDEPKECLRRRLSSRWGGVRDKPKECLRRRLSSCWGGVRDEPKECLRRRLSSRWGGVRDEPKECLRRRLSSVGLLIFWNWKTKYIKLMQENPWERNSISDETLQVCLHEWGVGA